MKKIALIIFATNKYASLIPELVQSAMKFFMKGHCVTYYIFTNNEFLLTIDSNQIKTIRLDSQPFPRTTLLRYQVISLYEYHFRNQDYIYQIDADMLFVNFVTDDIFAPLVAVQHPGYIGERGTPETNPESNAYIEEDKEITYCMGAFTGGERSEYLKMCEVIAENVSSDLKKDIIAIWWDESHLNKYLSTVDYLCLPPAYCYPPSYNLPYEPKIITLEKNHKTFQV